jgi:outer membrane cobalamin receptor
LGGGADLSLGAEFRINSHFTAFTDLNNIFGRNYQRWHNYPVYGFNAILGVIARF